MIGTPCLAAGALAITRHWALTALMAFIAVLASAGPRTVGTIESNPSDQFHRYRSDLAALAAADGRLPCLRRQRGPRHDGTMPEANGLDYSRYPDVATAGDLRSALQNEFDSAGMPLHAQHVESPGWVLTHAVVRADDRHVNIRMTSGDRAFGLDFWTPGFQMARSRTADLRDAAAAISMFLDGARLRRLGAAWPFVTFGPLAEAFERGEAEAIAFRWQRLLEPPPPRARHLHGLRDFLVAASGEPRLRALDVFTSHWDLGFRQSVRDGQSRALAWVRPFGEGRYLIAGADRRQLYTAGPMRRTVWGTDPVPGALGPAPARESVALVLTAMDRNVQA